MIVNNRLYITHYTHSYVQYMYIVMATIVTFFFIWWISVNECVVCGMCNVCTRNWCFLCLLAVQLTFPWPNQVTSGFFPTSLFRHISADVFLLSFDKLNFSDQPADSSISTKKKTLNVISSCNIKYDWWTLTHSMKGSIKRFFCLLKHWTHTCIENTLRHFILCTKCTYVPETRHKILCYVNKMYNRIPLRAINIPMLLFSFSLSLLHPFVWFEALTFVFILPQIIMVYYQIKIYHFHSNGDN